MKNKENRKMFKPTLINSDKWQLCLFIGWDGSRSMETGHGLIFIIKKKLVLRLFLYLL